MIISHKHKFIFIKTVKTAGTSIEVLLSTVCGSEDIITAVSPSDEPIRVQAGGVGPQNCHIPFKHYSPRNFIGMLKGFKRLEYYNHMSAAQIKQYVSSPIWDNYYKFCFERNPWDKFASWYYWKGGDKVHGSIENFLNSSNADKLRAHELYTIDNKIVVDDIFKFEKMQGAVDIINAKLGLNLALSSLPITKGATRKKKHYSDIISSKTAQWIKGRYKFEIDHLNYTF